MKLADSVCVGDIFKSKMTGAYITILAKIKQNDNDLCVFYILESRKDAVSKLYRRLFHFSQPFPTVQHWLWEEIS